MKVVLAFGLALCMISAARASDPQAFEQIEHGRYLAVAGDCAACHTAEEGAPYAGGKPIETPFGTLLAPNITPDRSTGIGTMSDDTFVRALQKGIGRDGRHLYPAMPYPFYTRMSRADILAIRAWLNTLPAQKNAVVVNQLPFPFRVRAVMSIWNELYFNKGEFKANPTKSAEWNRGAWLVEGPGHCGACHTPKSILGGDVTSRPLQGGLLQGWLAPNLTGDTRIGIGAWSSRDVVTYLQTGHNHQSAATGPMAEVVMDSTSRMTPEDLNAMAIYLKDQPALGETTAQAIGDTPAMISGRAIYVDNCAACHGLDGSGQPGLFPALRGNSVLQAAEANNPIHLILHGGNSASTSLAPTGPAMPAFGWKLDDQQVAALTTFIRNSWGNAAKMVDADAVHKIRDSAN